MPIAPSIEQKAIDSFVRRLATIRRNNERGVARGTRLATKVTKKAVDDRVYPAKVANRQDNPQRIPNKIEPYPKGVKLSQRTPVSSKSNPQEGIIRIKSYQASVRTGKNSQHLNRVLLKFLRSTGDYKLALRPGLKVSKYLTRNEKLVVDDYGNYILRRFEKKADYNKAKSSSDYVINLRYAGRPKLQSWGAWTKRGRQVFRHNVALPAEVRRRMIGVAALNATEERREALLLDGYLSGFDGRR